MEPRRVAQLAHEAGFDGVEWLLAGGAMRDPSCCLAAAEEFELFSTFHEAWTSREATTPSLVWKALQLIGWLPKSTIYDDRVPEEVSDYPVVTYAHHIVKRRMPRNAVFQTCSVADGRGRFAISFEDFVRELRQRPEAEIVVDLYHLLELIGGKPDGLAIAQVDKFPGLLTGFFDEFQKRIVEIHLADWSPTRGRNCPIGTGILPLCEFGQHVARSGWDGNVVPEVNPMHYLFGSALKLRRTLLATKAVFDA
jgi:hypothetical protein